MEPTENVRREIARIAATLDPHAVGERSGRHAVGAVPDFAERDDKDLEHEIIVAAASNVRAVLDGLAKGETPSEAMAPSESLAWVSTLAHRSIGPATIPRCYCIGQAMLDVALREATRAQDLPDHTRWEVAAAMSQFLFGYVEKIVGDLIEHYENERDRWLGEADSVRAELVLAMVDGRTFDPASASRALRYDLNRQHVALLVWADPRDAKPPPLATLKASATTLARALGGSDLLVVPAGQSVVWAWTTGERVTDAPERPVALEAGLLAAVGGLAGGARGFVRSHHQARRARRMVTLMPGPPGTVVLHRFVALSSLLTSDTDAAVEFVESELGSLAEETDANRRLRDTLTAFLEENMSWSRAARRLGVHQNTVIYRVRQAEDLLGHPVGERRPELEAALRIAEVLRASRVASTTH